MFETILDLWMGKKLEEIDFFYIGINVFGGFKRDFFLVERD